MSAKITRDPVAREWMRWAGRGQGRLGLLSDAAGALLEFMDTVTGGPLGWIGEPGSVTGRVRYILRGGPDAINAAWQDAGGPLLPVTVVHGGEGHFVENVAESNPFRLLIADLTPLGTLDWPPRPRFTTEHGVELSSGVVLGVADRIATLLLRKQDVAVIAILAGWPSPAELPHGQNAQEIVGSPS